MLKKELMDFLKDNASLIKTNDWGQVYKNFDDIMHKTIQYCDDLEDYAPLVGQLTSFLLSNGVNIGEYVEVLPPYAFFNCNSIKELDLPKVKIISEQAFWYCTNLTTLNIPNVISIDSYVFAGCAKLKYLNLVNIEEISHEASLEDAENITIEVGNNIIAKQYCIDFNINYTMLEKSRQSKEELEVLDLLRNRQ